MSFISDILAKLSEISTNINSLHQILSQSINTNTPLSQPQLNLISSQITSSIHLTILNANSLLTIPQNNNHHHHNSNIVEIDAVDLLSQPVVHFCQVCGKGFKRDANLRMHMRAHGNRFKTVQALSKPEKKIVETETSSRFSCPFVGCNRNKSHGKFRALKSVICLRNHFKRSHCPKMFRCDRCKGKSFSVVGDLKAHLKGCCVGRRGNNKWRCCCGTSFSRKDKLFGHVALFEGHMPVVEEEEEGKTVIEIDGSKDFDMAIDGCKNEDLERFFDGCGDEVDDCDWFRDGFDSPNFGGSEMEEFFNF